MAIKELNERQFKAIELLLKGETVTNTAKKIGVSRNSLNTWRNDPVFKAEMDKQVQTLKSNVDKKLLVQVEPLLDKLVGIALGSDSDKTSLDAIIYALNRVLGTPTNKTQNIDDNNGGDKDIKDIDTMMKKLQEKEDNVINFCEKAGK